MVLIAAAIFSGFALLSLTIFIVLNGQALAANRIAARLAEMVEEFDTLKVTFFRIESQVSVEIRKRQESRERIEATKRFEDRRALEAAVADGTAKRYSD
jgi:hypothetical protein